MGRGADTGLPSRAPAAVMLLVAQQPADAKREGATQLMSAG